MSSLDQERPVLPSQAFRTPRNREAERKTLNQQIEEFFARGGEKTECKSGASTDETPHTRRAKETLRRGARKAVEIRVAKSRSKKG